MMYNMDVRRRKGFSLIELLITIAVMLVLVGVAAFFLEDYVHKSKVAKATQDLDMFRSALNIYDSIEPKVFSAYLYTAADATTPANFGFNWNTLIASTSDAWSTIGGATTLGDWVDTQYNSLGILVGTYLKDFPLDPWGNAYKVNTSAGYVMSFGADGTTSDLGATTRNKDIVQYYLSKNPVLVDAVIRDKDGSGTVTAGDFLDLKFSKDIYSSNLALADVSILTNGAEAVNGATASPNEAVRLPGDNRTVRFVLATAGSLVVDGSNAENSSKIVITAASLTKIQDSDPYYTTNSKAGKVALSGQNTARRLRIE